MAKTPNILVIHGLAAKPSPEVLHEHVAYCLGDVRPEQIKLLYWADLAGWEPRIWNQPAAYRAPTKFTHVVRYLRGISRAFLRGSFEKSIAVALGLDPFFEERIFPEWVCALPVEKEGRHLLGAHLHELTTYFNERSQLRDSIIDRFVDERFPYEYDLVIAHSMGTIIMADLMQQGFLGPVKNIATIGSPLGLSVVRHALREYFPYQFELSERYTGEWVNVSDPLDIVALDSTLAGEYGQARITDVSIENDALDPNGKPHYHSLYGYLRSEPIQTLVRRSL